ncbi:MAG: hypothetical protein ACKOSS_01655, partial [Planctomycetia bacterium]
PGPGRLTASPGAAHRVLRGPARALLAVLALTLAAGCGGGGGGGGSSPPPPPPDPGLSALSDEFASGPGLAPGWSRLWQVEQWPYDQVESLDVGSTRAGWLTLVPYSSTWYQDYRGELTFKPITGDLVVTAHVEARNRAGSGAPARAYSLAGLMLRAPRQVTAATWTPGGEDYVFLSLGCADVPGSYQTEVKTTDDSVSVLAIAPGPSAATLRAARIGPHLLLLLRPEGGAWSVHRRYRRDDFPATLQAGLTVYTDWPTCSALTPVQHNNSLLTGGTPDLRAQVDYVRFIEPAVPAGLLGADLSNPTAVSDAELLAFLGFD